MNRLHACSYPRYSLEMVREDDQLFTRGDSATGASGAGGAGRLCQPQPGLQPVVWHTPAAEGRDSGAGRGARGCTRHGSFTHTPQLRHGVGGREEGGHPLPHWAETAFRLKSLKPQLI